jgi:hypothetical protein
MKIQAMTSLLFFKMRPISGRLIQLLGSEDFSSSLPRPRLQEYIDNDNNMP